MVVQLLGGAVAIAAIRALYPDLTPEQAAEVMLPQGDHADDMDIAFTD